MDFETLPLSQLRPGPNVRTVVDADADAQLRASIAAFGLLAPLIVLHDPVIDSDAHYRIIAGHRRFAALSALFGNPHDFDVPVFVVADDGDGANNVELTAALQAAENVCRQQLSDTELLTAFKRMADAGQSSDAIANSFGVTARKVDQLLALANAPAYVLTEWQAGRINRDCAEVLTQLSDDLLTTWRKAYQNCEWWTGKGADVRKHLVSKAQIPVVAALFDVNSPEAKLIPRTSDLFRAGDGEVFEDAVLFWNLQDKAINDRVAEIETMGFMSVEVVRIGTHGAVGMGNLKHTIDVEMRLSEEQKAKFCALRAEQEGLQDKVEAEEMREDDANDRDKEIEDEIENLDYDLSLPTDPELTKTGRCYLFVHPAGDVVVMGPALTWREHHALRSGASVGDGGVLELPAAAKKRKAKDADGFRVTAPMAALLVRSTEAAMFVDAMAFRSAFVFRSLVQHVGIRQLKRPATIASEKGWMDAMNMLEPVLKKASIKRMREVGAYFNKDDVDWKRVQLCDTGFLDKASAALCFLATGCANDEAWPSKAAPIFTDLMPEATFETYWRPTAAWLAGLSTKGLIFVGMDSGYSGRRTAMDLTKLKKDKIIPLLAEYFADAATPAWVPKSLRAKVKQAKKAKAVSPSSEAEAPAAPLAEAAE